MLNITPEGTAAKQRCYPRRFHKLTRCLFGPTKAAATSPVANLLRAFNARVHSGISIQKLSSEAWRRFSPLGLCGRAPHADMTTKPTISLVLSAKPTFSASWRPRRPLDGLTDAREGLLTPKTAFGRAY